MPKSIQIGNGDIVVKITPNSNFSFIASVREKDIRGEFSENEKEDQIKSALEAKIVIWDYVIDDETGKAKSCKDEIISFEDSEIVNKEGIWIYKVMRNGKGYKPYYE